MSFSPYVLFRRGTLGPAALSGVVPERTWALLAETAEPDDLRERLSDALHALIPTLPADRRRAWLKVRRDVHNGRVPSPPDDPLPPGTAALLREWTARQAESLRHADAVAAAYAEDLDAARKTLADVALGEDFQRGVQLSGEDVHREVRAYAADPFDTSRKPSRRRRAESTITSFAYRVAFKPSPFGSFTEIGAHPFAPGEGRGERVAMTRLSVGLLAWMAHQLHRLDCADDVLRVRINNSLLIDGDQAVFARRPLEGADDGFTPDRIVTARNSALVGLLRTLLGEHDRTVRDLRDRLIEAGLDREGAQNTIDQLVKLGLCHRGLGFPDQLTTQADAAARVLRAAGTEQAVRCAEVYEGLRDIEDRYADADAERRTGLLADLRALVQRFVDILGCPPPAREAMRAAMYEDVGTRAAAATWRPALLTANREHFALFQRIVPVLDDATIEKLGLYAFFARHYGEDHAGVPLLELYRAFSALTPQEASAVMCGVGDPASDQARDLRAEFFTFLREQPDDLRLDPAALAAYADALPATVVPWRSAAYRVQIGDKVVVNGVTTGHGVFFSRYCDLLETGDGWNLRTALREHIAATAPRQTDITAALGLNFNLHPRLSPHELVYPGSVPLPGAEPTLTLADLVVTADRATRRLTLVSTKDGQPIDLVPLNFLYPAAAPMLYRFLCAFAPTRTYRGGLWDQLDRVRPSTGHRPRVLLGDLVLDRRSWRFRAADLPDRDGLERQDLGAVTAFDRWRREHGLPRHTFFRVHAPRPVADGERDFLAETRQWALEARSARLHKPHYLDSRNPFLLHVLAKQARDGDVVFHECLPEPAEHPAEEFFVEYNLEGDAHVG
ncbi:lantibiotic dehydratase family protein [Actinokineospora sp. UTMC 2448]|uniref:lantibiotic dehydratase family protein n=1 Tax=Actinokineospora sp. UTMC 2448 TaxID=2268449 RepID=UPI002164B7D9|nr:lantibiotic dehydratase family protein [Actinokineospora sp. UTMC 2448]UVS78672.1 Dehydratase PerE [Actinokineospora sp. UTMC 2448]